MAGNDRFQLQVIAHATLSGANPPVTTLEGLTLAFTNPGVYVFTLDPGQALAYEPTKLRCVCTLLANSGIAQVAKTSATVVTVDTFAVDGTTPANKAFDLILFSSPI